MELDAVIGTFIIVFVTASLTTLITYSFRLIKKISKTKGDNLREILRELKTWKR